MKTRTINNGLALTVVAILLSACGGSGGDSNEPFIGAASPIAAATGVEQTASAADTIYVGITDEELGDLAEVPDTQTASLQVFNDFTFDTSRSTSVSMWVPEAVGTSAEATFCTDYSLEADGTYDVNYDSCVLTAPLLGGALNEELNLVNQHGSVIGVVWFQDPDMLPMFQEFDFE